MSDQNGPTPISYERAREMAQMDDPNVRTALAERDDVPPEILYFLSDDLSADVRRAVATNTAVQKQTYIKLAKDSDADVRGGLAANIAKVAPNLSAEESDKLRTQTREALQTLAQDQFTMVRAVLSDALKDVVDAPSDIIKLLAKDLELEVSGPVLEYSPVLTDTDLLEIIEQGPPAGSVAAIARRNGVSENLADAIIATDDIEGIGDLLGNNSAQIREEALDELIDRSASIDLWQAPLVARPHLPDGAAERMAGFLAESLLDKLRARDDLDGASLSVVSDIVRQRFSGDKEELDPDKTLSAGFDFLKVEPPLDTVRRLHENNKLSMGVIKKALQAGDQTFVYASLIVLGQVDVAVARKIFLDKNPYGIVALFGKAKLPSDMLVLAQQKMGRIAPSEVIEPKADGSFPMSDDDIDWHLEFFASIVDRGC
jgi:uncharacterized protein (DUF2336 family)